MKSVSSLTSPAPSSSSDIQERECEELEKVKLLYKETLEKLSVSEPDDFVPPALRETLKELVIGFTKPAFDVEMINQVREVKELCSDEQRVCKYLTDVGFVDCMIKYFTLQEPHERFFDFLVACLKLLRVSARFGIDMTKENIDVVLLWLGTDYQPVLKQVLKIMLGFADNRHLCECMWNLDHQDMKCVYKIIRFEKNMTVMRLAFKALCELSRAYGLKAILMQLPVVSRALYGFNRIMRSDEVTGDEKRESYNQLVQLFYNIYRYVILGDVFEILRDDLFNNRHNIKDEFFNAIRKDLTDENFPHVAESYLFNLNVYNLILRYLKTEHDDDIVRIVKNAHRACNEYGLPQVEMMLQRLAEYYKAMEYGY